MVGSELGMVVNAHTTVEGRECRSGVCAGGMFNYSFTQHRSTVFGQNMGDK